MSRFTSYYLYQRYEKVGDGEWTPTYPNEYSISGDTLDPMPLVIKEQNDANCGYYPPIYRWTDTDDTICVEADHDYSRDYLTIESEVDNNYIYFSAVNNSNPKVFSASTDNGVTWTEYTSSPLANIAVLNIGEKVLMKGLNSAYSTSDLGQATYNHVTSTGYYKAYGNIMSMVSGDSFTSATSVADYAFQGFFISTKLTSAENLILPATTLGKFCYADMFEHGDSLTTAPSILPATTLAEDCYGAMFAGCTGLTTAPIISATTLAPWCCSSMFYRCESLTTAPELLATTLVDGCYQNMFKVCSSLNYIKCLATTRTSSNCTAYWVDGVSPTGTFVKDANTTWSTGVDGIPTNWTIQNA